MLESYNMLSDFTICGFQDISLYFSRDFRTLNSVGGTKDYEDHNRLSVFSPEDECEPIMTSVTMQLI